MCVNGGSYRTRFTRVLSKTYKVFFFSDLSINFFPAIFFRFCVIGNFTFLHFVRSRTRGGKAPSRKKKKSRLTFDWAGNRLENLLPRENGGENNHFGRIFFFLSSSSLNFQVIDRERAQELLSPLVFVFVITIMYF